MKSMLCKKLKIVISASLQFFVCWGFVAVKLSYWIIAVSLALGAVNASAQDSAQEPYFPKGAQIFNRIGMNFQRLLELCVREPKVCDLTSNEAALLKKIHTNYMEDAKGGLGLVDPKDNPGFFDLDPQSSHRFARTGEEVGEIIYLNTDQLDKVDFFTAIAILVHEFGHHYGVLDTKDRPLDVLGAKVATAIRRRTQIIDLSSFNQPHLKFYVVNLFDDLSQVLLDGSDNDRRKGTMLFREDGETFSVEHDHWESYLVCPAGAPKRGPLWISNLRLEDPFDWSETKQLQGFALRGSLQMVCYKEGDAQSDYRVLNLSLRTGFYLEPLTGPSVPDWWRTSAGRFSAQVAQNAMVQESVSLVDRYFRSNANRPIVLKNLQYTQESYQAGEAIQARAEFVADQDLSQEQCQAFFTSPQFKSFIELPRHKVAVPCRLQKLSGNKYSLDISWQTPSPTVTRDFYLESVSLFSPDAQVRFTGLAERRTYVHLNSAPIENPLAIHSLSMMRKRVSDKKAAPFAISIDPHQSHSYPFQRDDFGGVLINILNPKELLPQSRIEFMSSWEHKVYGRIESSVFTASATQEEGPLYQLPFNFNNQTVVNPQFPGVSWVYVLRGAAYSEAGEYRGNPAHSHKIKRFYLINKNLEEIYVELDINMIYPD